MKKLMPAWFVPALMISGVLALVSGIRVLKDQKVASVKFEGEKPGEPEWMFAGDFWERQNV